jgi:hypothetical protein
VKKRGAPPHSNREHLTEDDLLRKLLDLLFRYRGLVRITILKNIALLTHSLLTLFQGARGGNGWLSQAAVARCLPLEIGPKGRQLRFFRFLTNPRVVPETLIPLHVALVCGLQVVRERLPMILDQTTIRGIPTLLIGLVFEGRGPVCSGIFFKKASLFWSEPKRMSWFITRAKQRPWAAFVPQRARSDVIPFFIILRKRSLCA